MTRLKALIPDLGGKGRWISEFKAAGPTEIVLGHLELLQRNLVLKTPNNDDDDDDDDNRKEKIILVSLSFWSCSSSRGT